MARWIKHYNTVCLHLAIGYLAPADKRSGLEGVIHAERDRKLEEARPRRQQMREAARSPKLHQFCHSAATRYRSTSCDAALVNTLVNTRFSWPATPHKKGAGGRLGLIWVASASWLPIRWHRKDRIGLSSRTRFTTCPPRRAANNRICPLRPRSSRAQQMLRPLSGTIPLGAIPYGLRAEVESFARAPYQHLR